MVINSEYGLLHVITISMDNENLLASYFEVIIEYQGLFSQLHGEIVPLTDGLPISHIGTWSDSIAMLKYT